jgi:hypothetical protein
MVFRAKDEHTGLYTILLGVIQAVLPSLVEFVLPLSGQIDILVNGLQNFSNPHGYGLHVNVLDRRRIQPINRGLHST